MDEKKLIILKKAKELFFIYGVRKTTVDEIAKAAGIGKGTVYLYFSSKKEIVSSLAIQESNTIASQLDKVIAKENSAEGKLRVFIKSFILNCYDFVNSNIHAADIFNEIQKYTNTCETEEQNHKAEMSETMEIITNIFLEGKKEGAFKFDDLANILENVTYALRSYFPPLSTGLSKENLNKKSDYIINIIVNDLKTSN